MAGKPWFAAKRYGYGSGLPISWEGWAVLTIFVLAVLAAAICLAGLWRIAAFVGLTALFMLIAARKTAGGWRWRKGEEP